MTEPRDERVAASSDAEVVSAQLGRPIRGAIEVARRCPLGLPVVVAVPPIVDGTPFPTRYWLTCPLARRRVARLEGAGGVRAFDARLAHDDALGAELAQAHARYAAEREVALETLDADVARRPEGGVAGIGERSSGVKCLHAHFADHAAGGENPVGREISAFVEPLDCEAACVGDAAWREPPHAVSGPEGDPAEAVARIRGG
ncbi:MAG: DUF501 domain-containing protein [Myxococcales bacterium]|nr:DUF501 domain-containing protein [Myxococcales bacterium]